MKKFKILLSALALSVASLLIFAAPKAFAATKTWDGGGSDANMTTGANWAGDSAPSAGEERLQEYQPQGIRHHQP